MNWQRLLDFGRDRLLVLGLASITNNTIVLPNQTTDTSSFPLWVELSCIQTGELPYTETTAEYIAVINHVVCVPKDTTTDRANNIAARIAGLYSLRNPEKCCFELNSGETLIVDEIEQLPGEVAETAYMINTRVTFKVYKNERI